MVSIHEGSTGQVPHILANNRASLVYLANQGTVTFYSWPCTRNQLGEPDQVNFYLDPPGDDFEPVREAALTTNYPEPPYGPFH